MTTYTEQELDNAILHISKCEGWNWSEIKPQQRVRTIESILATIAMNWINEDIVDTNDQIRLLAESFRDVQRKGYFNFTKG